MRGGDLWGAEERTGVVQVSMWFLKPCPRQDAENMNDEDIVGDTEIPSEIWAVTGRCLVKSHNKEITG